jgi:putative nucleotidyltransferase with HDIG domain
MRQLPRVLVATLLVIACPAAAVLALDAAGLVTSPVALSLIAIPLSVAISWVGAAFWKRRAASGDLVFGDLMLWGWLRRWRFERLFSHTATLVGTGPEETAGATGLGRERRARLLERLSRALEARDPRTHGHSRRVARHAAAIARRMSLPREEVARIRTAAVLHDVGKIDTPKEIIDKPGPLSEAEYKVVKRHAPVGARMVAALGDARLTAFVRSHHERLDGGGYPDGLAGEEIPLGARIIAVADTFDAVTSARPYRQAIAHREALALLAAEAGTQLDPEVVRGFRSYYSGYRPVALWTAFLALPRQAGFLLLDLPRFGSALTSAKVAAASVATVAVGAAAVHPATPASNSGGPIAAPVQRLASEQPGSASAPTDPGPPNGGRNTDRDASVEVSSPGVAEVPAPESASTPSGTTTNEGGGSAGGEDSSGTAAKSPPDQTSPSSGGSGGSSQSPAAPVTTPVETVAPPVKPVTSTVNQTVEEVGSTVNQVVTPVVESVNGILGGGK